MKYVKYYMLVILIKTCKTYININVGNLCRYLPLKPNETSYNTLPNIKINIILVIFSALSLKQKYL